MPYDPPPELAGLSLAQIAEQVAARNLPPLDTWDPPETEHSGMRITADGRWFHRDSPITRPAMVRAFASLLRREDDGRYFLVTPHHKQAIDVEDAAFIAVDCKADGDALAFRLNTDELVLAGPHNPLRAQGDADTPAIYLSVRHGCEARLDRSTWLQLADIALADGGDLSVGSQGATFALRPA
ncbi:DUF1285 domain-containing protein [Aurantiacibacter aquimixticola]|uniref:DUF1285 domain-containing protein n=1 Tax=Aurantiacibacter aquimixticola TaxID=1958945 RepID=A0A419RQZ5_9SPHN|nr:DUF1285 domain-containing protein [Aurantiacibacter aquimixticola]RJY08218.1 DUF1285 domain-containing protein [Aurantiacibacter aquimixticola]